MKTSLIVILLAYGALLALSWANEEPLAEPRPGVGPGRVAVEIRPQGEEGPLETGLASDRAHLSFLHWPAQRPSARPPIVCLHGSPGSARNFEDLAPRLAASGWDVWALDLPGFGRSAGPVGGLSILAHARATLAALDALGIERFHVITWSMGGGVGLHVADFVPARVASLSLISSIGVQEAEGSGNYSVEHAKYLALLGAFNLLDHGVPHFGGLSPMLRDARAFALNFWQTDQRPLRHVLERLALPTFIAHGREDFLAPAWAAETSHQLVANSRLVLYDASHFLPLDEPFGQLGLLLEELKPFLERHDAPGQIEEHVRVDAGRAVAGLRRSEPEAFALVRRLPWWLHALAVAAAAFAWPFVGAVFAGVFVASLQMDFGLAALSAIPGVVLNVLRREPTSSTPWRRPLAAALAPLRFLAWMLVVMVLSGFAAMALARWGPGDLPRALGPLLAGWGVIGAHAFVRQAWARRKASKTALGPAPS